MGDLKNPIRGIKYKVNKTLAFGMLTSPQLKKMTFKNVFNNIYIFSKQVKIDQDFNLKIPCLIKNLKMTAKTLAFYGPVSRKILYLCVTRNSS